MPFLEVFLFKKIAFLKLDFLKHAPKSRETQFEKMRNYHLKLSNST